MNAKRRKEIGTIKEKAINLRKELENVLKDEKQYFEILPKNLKESDNGERSAEAIDAINIAIAAYEDVEELLDEVINL